MIHIKSGERGPRVVMVQVFLNRLGSNLQVDGKPVALKVDGVWAGKTTDAVIAFRKKLGYSRVGVVDGNTWRELTKTSSLQIVDLVDRTAGQFEATNQSLEEAGSDTIETERHTGWRKRKSIKDVVRAIIHQAKGPGSILLLRFYGHGNHGTWLTLAIGDPVHTKERDPEAYKAMAADWSGYISPDTIDRLTPQLKRLTPYFAPFGSVEHNGCNVAQSAAMQVLLGKLANLWGVPVTGGFKVQQSGSPETTFAFEGPTYTAYPQALSLEQWASLVAGPASPEKPGPIKALLGRFGRGR